MTHVWRTLRVGFLLALTFGAIAAGRAQEAAEPKVRGLLFYADWCAKCKVLEPTLYEAIEPFEKDGRFELVFLDLTDQRPQAIASQRLEAARVGAERAFNRYAPKTGHIVFVDATTGKQIDRLTSRANYETIQERLRAAIEKAS